MIRLLLAVPCLALIACSDQEPQPQPSSDGPRARAVVLFTIDTLRADRIRMYRQSAPPSPATERLAESSLVFDRAYSQASNTSPAMASVLTGLLPPRHGVVHQTAKMSGDVVSLPVMLQVAGVRTGSFVANLCKLQDVKPSVFNEGWGERFCGMDDALPQHEWDRAVVDAGIDFIRRSEATGEPYLAWIHLMDPHSEYDPAPQDWDHEANPLREKVPQMQFLSRFEETLKPPPSAVLAKLNRLYDAEITGADRQLGRLLDFLDELPGGDEVAVIFSADHGEELYETWHRIGHGFSMTDAVLHVPLSIRAPGVEPGRSSALVETLSISPTILGLLGLEAPYRLDGETLLQARPGRTAARSFESGVAMTLRTADHRFWKRTVAKAPTRKFAAWRLQAPWFERAECLATLDGPWQNMPRWMDIADPNNAALLGNLRDEAQRVMDSVTGLVIEEITDEAYLAQLRALGYLGEEEKR
jgi:arylsulfatase A-like enzyme